MIAQPDRADAAAQTQADAPRVRPVVRPAAPSAPAPIPPPARADEPDPSGFGFAAPAVQPGDVRAAAPARRPARAPQRPPRWPHLTAAVAVPVAGAAGFVAAVTASAVPLQILTFTVVGGFVVVKVAGPVRAVAAALAAAIAKVGPR